MRSSLAFLASLVLISGTMEAQDRGKWTVGIHGGADVTDNHTLKLLGAHLGVAVAPGTRLQLAVTSVIEEPGTTIFALASAQWSPAPWLFRPYIGAGAGMGYQEVGPFSNTDFGWLAQGGFRIALRNFTPFAEFRLIGLTGTTSQIVVGLEGRTY